MGVLGGTVEFAPGGTETFIEISVLDDDHAEPAREYLLVSLTPPPEGAGWALGLSEATLSANGERASFVLDGLFSPSEAGDQLSYEAESDRPDLLSVRIRDDALLLLVANEDGAEGTAIVTVTATDPDGQSASLSFSVTVEFAPQRLLRSWRLEWMRTLREAAQ